MFVTPCSGDLRTCAQSPRPCLPPFSLGSVPEECPQEVMEIMQRCFKLEPSQRPTAPELVELLTAAPATSMGRANSMALLPGAAMASPFGDPDAGSVGGRPSLDESLPSPMMRALSVGPAGSSKFPSTGPTTSLPSVEQLQQELQQQQQQQLQQQQVQQQQQQQQQTGG